MTRQDPSTPARAGARIIDGAALALRIREDVARRVQALAAKGVRPGLAVVLVGADPASQVYVRNKVAACEKAGLYSIKEQYPADMTEAELLARIDALNRDPAIHGILVQLPLPSHKIGTEACRARVCQNV